MKIIKMLSLFLVVFLLSGCFESNSMENIKIRTTVYPVQYVVERLYGNHSKVENIYPDGSKKGEIISDKLLKDYSSTDLFIFNGLDENDNDYVTKIRRYNKKLKIIDVASSLTYDYSVEELWLDPMNLLTMANNIKRGFAEYIESAYLLEDINKNYDELRQELIQLEADYREMVGRASKKTIITSDDTFLYLQKYGINVLSLEENDNLTQKNIYTAKKLITDGDVKYIYTIEGKEINDTVKKIKKETDVELIQLHPMFSRTEEEANRDEDYFSLMKENLELLKKELYN